MTPSKEELETEAIEIHCQAPALNRDTGYELLAIYWDVFSRDIFNYQLNHVTKHPMPLDKDSERESKACISA